MTDEEKEAIEFWNGQINLYSKGGRPHKTLQILLNLIEKKDQIIENQKFIIQERDTEISDLKDSKCLVKRYFKLKDENKRKDKIIDEMAYCIYNHQICDYEITDYTYRKCEYIRDDETPPCKQCIKEYFEKKEEV